MPERLDEEELADWRAGRNAVYRRFGGGPVNVKSSIARS
jgi:hypothetical protein